MWNFVLARYIDLAMFCALGVVTTLVVHIWLRRSGVKHGIGPIVWLMLVVLLAGGSALAYFAGESERQQLKLTLQGFAPTYAEELARLGHAAVNAETAPDDPTYLKLIDAEKRWQKINPAVNDIYTFRKTSEGKFIFIVDSETDYDHNGVFDGEREQRTAIGEVYEEPTDSFEQAVNGIGGFDGQPQADRWGVWVTATCPLYGPDGKVDGGVGVDFDANNWVWAILVRRAGVLGFTGVALAILVGSGGTISLAKNEIGKRREAEESARRAELRLQTILDNEPEGVLVCSSDGHIRQLNPSSIHLFELAVGDDRNRSLLSFVAPEEQARVGAWLKTIASGQPGRQTIRVIGNRGGEKWLDAHAVPLKWGDEASAEVLIVARDVTAARAAEVERERLQSQLVTASRQAGMADIATGILHNVGNVLNTINVSAHIMTDKLRQSRVPSVGKAADLLIEQRATLPEFLTTDVRGKQFPDFLGKLAGVLRTEHEEMLGTLRGLSEGLDHLKAIVHSQQSFAGKVRVEEALRPAAVFEEAVKLNVASCERHHVNLVREFAELPAVSIDKHKTLQILINLITNAKDAIKSKQAQDGKITLRLTRGENAGKPSVRFEVRDNGVGIKPENLNKIFSMGFTTRKDGHGFGLHSAANFAKEMGGRLLATSDGQGCGAAFVLELPFVAGEVLA
ncbi:hypothetical protein BH10PLA1_BH10PLA1_14430 [soil metagenome]